MLARLRAVRGTRQLWQRGVSSLPPLPPKEEWKSIFSILGLSSRVFLRDSALADKLAASFFKYDRDTASRGSSSKEGKVVIEAFPGPGCLTRSLLKLPHSKIKKLIILEDVQQYLEYLTPLEAADPRVVIVPLSGFHWSTYTELEARGLLDDIVAKPWEDERPNLHFVGHIPNAVLGEQLTSQFWRLIPERSWLFKYGRVPMSLILSDNSYRRAIAKPGSKEYCKLSVIADAVSSISEAVPFKKLQPYGDYFHPPGNTTVDRRGTFRPVGSPYAAINVLPTANPAIEKGMLDKWDYILRRFFVLKTTPIRRAINSLGPGAANLLPIIGDSKLPKNQRVDINKKVRELDINDWSVIVKAFDEWPFAPADLHITDAIYKDIERG